LRIEVSGEYSQTHVAEHHCNMKNERRLPHPIFPTIRILASLFIAFRVSIEALDAKMRERYYALAVLLEDMAIHPLIQRVFWKTTDQFDALKTAEEFIRLALAERAGNDGGSIRLHDLLLDYVRAQYPDPEALKLIHDAMRLSSHIIERDPTQFASQLVGRLLPYMETPAVRDFSQRVVRGASRPWLRPLKSALQPLGTGLLRTLEGHGDGVNAVAVTPDGRRAVSACEDGTLKVWDLESGRQLQTSKATVTGSGLLRSRLDGRRVLSASFDGTLKVWDLENGHELRTLEGHGGEVTAVTVTPDGQRVLSASADGTIKVWDLESGRELRTLEGHGESVRAVAVTPNGRRAVSASADRTLKVWELESDGELRALRRPRRRSQCRRGHAGRPARALRLR
jgi:WD40 repeat protein